MTIRVIIKNDEQETSPHNLIVGVLESYSEDFVEKHVLAPAHSVTVNIWGSRTLVIAEAPLATPIITEGSPPNLAFIREPTSGQPAFVNDF